MGDKLRCWAAHEMVGMGIINPRCLKRPIWQTNFCMSLYWVFLKLGGRVEAGILRFPWSDKPAWPNNERDQFIEKYWTSK